MIDTDPSIVPENSPSKWSVYERRSIDRARFRPTDIDPDMTEADVSFLGVDPSTEVDEVWWEEMLVKWFETPEEELEETDEESEASSEDPPEDDSP